MFSELTGLPIPVRKVAELFPNGLWALLPSERDRLLFRYFAAAFCVSIVTSISMVLPAGLDPANIAMIYLIGVVGVAIWGGKGPSVFASFLSVAALDFFFVHPYFTFVVSDTQYLITLFVMLLVALVIAEMTAKIREQFKVAQEIETERIKNALLQSVSHDLRTPLAAIAGSASVLMDDAPLFDERLCRSLAGSIYEESQRLNRIIENLVCATRIESGSVSLSKEWVSVEEIVGTALKRMETRLEGRTVSTEMCADLPLIMADGLLLELAVVNVIENAVKHTPAGTSIHISTASSNRKVVVRISDNGAGIEPALKKEVFKRFFRSGTQSGDGMGLGLYICAGIIQAHRGRIYADNSVNGGAVFTFELPASEVPELSFLGGEIS